MNCERHVAVTQPILILDFKKRDTLTILFWADYKSSQPRFFSSLLVSKSNKSRSLRGRRAILRELERIRLIVRLPLLFF